jgi:diguanylate cyclase (GGDEF)-like protein
VRVVTAVATGPVLAGGAVVVLSPDALIAAALLCVGIVVSIWSTTRLVVRPLRDSVVSATLDRGEMEHALLAERADRDFRARSERALQLATAEPVTLRTGLRAVAEAMPDAEVTLLLNVPDEPRVGWVVRLVDGGLEAAVPIEGTPSCVALATATTVTTATSESLEACGHLHDPHVEVSAICVPMRLGDRLLGTVCLTSAPGDVPDPAALARVEWVVERTGVRVAEQRLQRGPSMAGRPDPITNLPGPAALRHQLRDLVRTLSPFCVAIIALDAFEQLGYDYGEEMADDALRIVADVLCTTLRPGDLVCRIEGPRFAVVLDECTATQATAAMERVRESLALLLASEGDPPFTCSAGIVESHRATSLDEILELADSACVEARAAGGNRVALAGG